MRVVKALAEKQFKEGDFQGCVLSFYLQRRKTPASFKLLSSFPDINRIYFFLASKFDDLGPPGRGRKGTGKSSGGGGHVSGCAYRTDNVWHHEKSRRKLKHLSEQPPCHCGAGRYHLFVLCSMLTNSFETIR